jgi:hypothetical protein
MSDDRVLPTISCDRDWSFLEAAFIALDLPPDHHLLARLEAMDVTTLDTDHLHELLADVAKVEARIAGMKHRALDALATREPGSAPEIAASALNETTVAAGHLVGTAVRLVGVHPEALVGMAAGTVGIRHAQVLARECAALPDEVARAVDAQVWERVGETADPMQVRRAARSLALSVDAQSQATRVKANRAERRIELSPGPDGTTWLAALLATEDAVACRDSLNARTVTKDPEDSRSRGQRAADLFVQDLTGRPPLLVAEGRWVGPASEPSSGSGRKARDRRVEIGVLVPFDVLAGLREGHATIDGQPVPASVARGLFQSDGAMMRRLLIDPVTGHLLDRALTTYKPGKQLQAFIKARDQECWWPGCHVRARGCDEDHKQPFPAGPTSRVNVGDLCEHHHQLKHSRRWTIRVRDDGTVDLTGPHGQTVHVPYPRLDDDPIAWDPPDPDPEPLPVAATYPDEEPPF